MMEKSRPVIYAATRHQESRERRRRSAIIYTPSIAIALADRDVEINAAIGNDCKILLRA
jgi:hypothetical protein